MMIQRMNESHIPQIAALEAACFSAPWSEDCLRYELTNSLALWLAAVEGEKVVGYVGSQTVMGESDMMNLAVDPEQRRMGIGASLVNALVAALHKQGSTCLTLEVRASNAQAISLYRSLGFVQVGKRPNYYRNPREDALILRKEWQL